MSSPASGIRRKGGGSDELIFVFTLRFDELTDFCDFPILLSSTPEPMCEQCGVLYCCMQLFVGAAVQTRWWMHHGWSLNRIDKFLRWMSGNCCFCFCFLFCFLFQRRSVDDSGAFEWWLGNNKWMCVYICVAYGYYVHSKINMFTKTNGVYGKFIYYIGELIMKGRTLVVILIPNSLAGSLRRS